MGADAGMDPVWNISEFTAGIRVKAAASGLPVIDLGQGGPTDPTPQVARDALVAAVDAPGYPKTQGSAALRQAFHDWALRRFGAEIPADAVIPTVGSKELIAGLPGLLGLSDKSSVVVPELAYPTYAYGAQRVGASVSRADSTLALGPVRPNLMWLNTPSNPTGKVLPTEHLRKVVDWARERDCLLVSDECYVELGVPGAPMVSVLSPDVNGGRLDGILAVHSLSKRSSMAGYRIGFVSGDPDAVAWLLRQRRDLGLIVPDPMQAVAAAVLADDAHVMAARRRYAERRQLLAVALSDAGFTVPPDQAGLFVWTTRDEPGEKTVDWLASLGLVVAPGSFYGPRGRESVRFSLTVADVGLAEAAERIASAG